MPTLTLKVAFDPETVALVRALARIVDAGEAPREVDAVSKLAATVLSAGREALDAATPEARDAARRRYDEAGERLEALVMAAANARSAP